MYNNISMNPAETKLYPHTTTPFGVGVKFPKGFLLGAASSAHQVEGNNTKNDWWVQEQAGRLPKSGLAADHYNRYEEDFKVAKEIGLNAMRISIEWSRIEPEEGKWNSAAIEHYRKVLKSMKEQGLVRMVTLWHWTFPNWLADKGGFETKNGVQAFARFAWFVAENLGHEIDLWVTINEPEVYAGGAYQQGKWPPFKKSIPVFLKVIGNLISAHKAAFGAIKQVNPAAKIGIAKNSAYLEAYRNKFMDRVVVKIGNFFGNHYFLRRISKQMDFIGLNYYFSERLAFDFKSGFRKIKSNDDEPHSDMGWRTYPEGIYYLLRDLKKYNKPIYITENGIANARDEMRQQFIKEHLFWIKKCIDLGIDIKGYFYWSLTDTYEWQDGFDPKFGLVEVNFETQARRVRASARVFKEINS